jgi:hypothetical protein
VVLALIEARRKPLKTPRGHVSSATNLPSPLDIRQFERRATMENTTFDWLDNDYALNFGTPEVPTSIIKANHRK